MIYRTEQSKEPIADYIPFSGMEHELPNVKLTIVRASGPWYSSHLAGIQLADAVIVISGGRGSEIAGYNSFILEKPLLPIPVFGGGAKRLWNDFRRLYATVGLTGDESRYLFDEWGPKSSVCVSSALDKISSNNPFSERSRRLWLVAVGTAAGLFVAWLSVFYFGLNGSLSRDISVVLLMLISALMGTTLRQVLRMSGPKPAKVDVGSLAAEAVAGSLIAFGFLMFFYLGTVVITGAPISLSDLTDAHAATENFRRLAFSMTILGMAAAFLLERAANALTRRFRTRAGGSCPSGR